jgi:hypothetical protein
VTNVDASPLDEPTVQGEGWFNSRWRPAMAWQYFCVCLFDFIIAPSGTAIINGTDHSHAWQSLTLQGGGLYHVAMGGIIGVATYMRSQEKLAVFNGPASAAMSSSSTTISSTEQKRSVPDDTNVSATSADDGGDHAKIQGDIKDRKRTATKSARAD